jgi:AAA+ ATPase superfamily predicted ATPase
MTSKEKEIVESDLQWTCPARILIAGSTLCGKTSLIVHILKHRKKLFDSEFGRIIYCYNPSVEMTSQLENDLKSASPTIEFLQEAIPDQKALRADTDQHSLIIFDDQYSTLLSQKDSLDLFTHGSHHAKLTLILSSQNYFHQDKNSKGISRNFSLKFIFQVRGGIGVDVVEGEGCNLMYIS